MAKLTARLTAQGAVLAILSLVVFSVSGLASYAESTASATAVPSEIVSSVIDRVKETVNTNAGKLSSEELDKKLYDLIAPVFDFETMAQSCLAQDWSEATPEQQKEFVQLFSQLLAKTYLKKIRENSVSSELKILGEKTKGDRAIVKTSVTYDEDQTASIEYRMKQHSGSNWRVYDVIVENIGLVSNYRSEFSSIVKKGKIEGLLVKLRSKSVETKA